MFDSNLLPLREKDLLMETAIQNHFQISVLWNPIRTRSGFRAKSWIKVLRCSSDHKNTLVPQNIMLIRGLRQLAANGWIIVAFTIFALVMGPVRSSANSTPWGVYSPRCHHSAGNYSNIQAITVQPGTQWFVGQESAHIGEVLCPRMQCHTVATETHTPRPLLDPNWWATATVPQQPEIIRSMYSDGGIVRMITAGSLYSVLLLYLTHC